MKRILPALLAFLTCFATFSTIRAFAAEPYPFKARPREFPKTDYLRVDFEGVLPAGTELGEGVTIEPDVGTGKSMGLVSRKNGMIVKFPILQYDLGMSRFDLTLDHGGENFAFFDAKLNAYDKEGKLLRTTSMGGEWGYGGMRTWEIRERNLEFDNIYSIELVIEQQERERWEQNNASERVVRLDNIVLRRHEARVIYGDRARKELQAALRDEGLQVTDLGDLVIGEDDERQSFFDFGPFKPHDSFVRSHWQERAHIGTTYKITRGKRPSFILGVQARQAALEAAATAQKKSLLEMYEFFLDDVSEHGFNTVWVDFTKELELFDEMAAKRGIHVILKDPTWSGLSTWIAKPNDPMPDAFKSTAATNLAKYAAMKSLLAYHMDQPLNRNYEPMLAKAREYLNSVSPNLQLITEQSDLYAAEAMVQPYANMGIQTTAYHHYIGWPYGGASHMYHPNYWANALTEGWYRRIHSAFEVRYMPTLVMVPSGRQFGKKSIAFDPVRVDPKVNRWVYDEETKRWSGWYRYKFPPLLLRCIVWKAIQSGAGGVLIDDWGPATIAADVKGPDILKDTKYGNTNFEPDMLRQPDLSESANWNELGNIGRDLMRYKNILGEATRHGNNTARVDNGNVRVTTLTGRTDPFKLLVVVNTKVGDYEEDEIAINQDTGALENYSLATPQTFVLTVDQDAGLIDVSTGETIEPIETVLKNRAAKYELTLGPGEGRLLFRGKRLTYTNFIAKYKIETRRPRTDVGAR